MKCRLRSSRVRAIELLRLCPAREGLWHRDSVIQVAEWKLMRDGRDVLENAENETIPGCARIHSERMERCMVDGKPILGRSFKQESDSEERLEVWNAEVSSLTAAMGDML